MKKLIAFCLLICLCLSGCVQKEPTRNIIKTPPQKKLTSTQSVQIEKTSTASEPTIPIISQSTTIQEKKAINYFNENIIFDFSYIKNDNTMLSYSLIKPTKEPDYEMPLIVFLHGLGEVGAGEPGYKTRSLTKILGNWESTPFNAYVMCPSLSNGGWNGPYIRDRLEKTLNDFIANNNVDVNKIIICGHSLGGIGTQYMAYELQEYFSAQVIISGYGVNAKIEEITIPTRAYVGKQNCGEDSNSVKYTHNTLKNIFGEESIFSLDAGHSPALKMSFTLDEDGNNKSDLLEWMFKQSKE